MGDVALMYSGGLDSFVAYHYGRAHGLNVMPIYVALGHEYEGKEILAAECLQVPFKVVDLPWGKLTKEWHVKQIIPARNVLLAMVGSLYADRVWICGLDGEQFATNNDKSIDFYSMTSSLLSHVMHLWNIRGTRVESPFMTMTKRDVVSWWLTSGRDPKSLQATTSCWSPGPGKCGECATCYKRYVAFKLNGIEEEGYQSNPLMSAYAQKEAQRMSERDVLLRHSWRRVLEYKELCTYGMG